MKWCSSNGRVLTLMLALAFFNFIFLGIEYQFDNMMALVTGPEQVVTAQGYVLGASVLGFLLYPAAASCIIEKFSHESDPREPTEYVVEHEHQQSFPRRIRDKEFPGFRLRYSPRPPPSRPSKQHIHSSRIQIRVTKYN